MGFIRNIYGSVGGGLKRLSAEFNDHILTSKLLNGISLASQIRLLDHNFSFSLCITTGAFQDSPGKKGTAHFLEHVLTTPELRRSFENRRGGINLATSTRNIEISGHVENTAENRSFVLSALKDVLDGPLDIDGIERERLRINNEINMELDSPENHFCFMASNLYEDGKNHGSIMGTQESLLSITREDLEEYRGTYFHGGNIYMGFSGKYDQSKFLENCAEIFSPIQSGERSAIILSPYVAADGREGQSNVKQLYFSLHFPPLPSSTSRELVTSYMATNCLSSAIREALTDENGMVYHIDARLVQHFFDTHTLRINASILPPLAGNALPVIADRFAYLTSSEGLGELARYVQNIQYQEDRKNPSIKLYQPKNVDSMTYNMADFGGIPTEYQGHKDLMSIKPLEVQESLESMIYSGEPSILAYGDSSLLQTQAEFVSMIKEARKRYDAPPALTKKSPSIAYDMP